MASFYTSSMPHPYVYGAGTSTPPPQNWNLPPLPKGAIDPRLHTHSRHNTEPVASASSQVQTAVPPLRPARASADSTIPGSLIGYRPSYNNWQSGATSDPSFPPKQPIPSTADGTIPPYPPPRFSAIQPPTSSVPSIVFPPDPKSAPPSSQSQTGLSRSYAKLDLDWDTVFDAKKHRVPVLPATWFQDGWELAGVHVGNILFVEKSEKKRRVQVYDVLKMSIRLIDVKYEAASLSVDGKYLLVAHGKLLSILSVNSEKVLKKHKTKNLHVRKWTSNSKAFCWVDTEGRFWRWSFTGPSEPEQVFKLQERAPKAWMTPISNVEGTWLGIVATDPDRKIGVVHCYPEDNGSAQIYEGPAAAAFTQISAGGATEPGVALISVGKDATGDFLSLDMYGLGRLTSSYKRHGRTNVPGGTYLKLFPELYIDPDTHLLCTAISTSDGSLALIFEAASGSFVASRKIGMDAGDRIYCGLWGVHMERSASMFRRLKLQPDGPLDLGELDAEEALFQRPRRGSTDGSVAALSTSTHTRTMTTTTDATSLSAYSSGSKATKKTVNTPLKNSWGRGNFAVDSDETWLLSRQRQFRWMKSAEED